MPDYSKTIIYKICCKDTEIKEIYVGSTCNLTNRRYTHKAKWNNELYPEYNFKVYQFIRDNGGWENWTMIMVDEANLENKLQKEKLEREWYEKLGATLNSQIPTRTEKEYRLTNKETISIRHKEHYEKNKEEILIKKKEYNAKNKEKVRIQKKEHYEKNKEKLSIRHKEHYEKNKEIFNKKFVCECGGSYSYFNKTRHNKSKKHISKTAIPI